MKELIIVLIGALSAYGQAPTDGTIAARLEFGQIQDRPYEFYAAVANCDHIGRPARLYAGDLVYDGVIFDCAGDRASVDWMACTETAPRRFRPAVTRCQIAAEVDFYFWESNDHLIGSAVRLEILKDENKGRYSQHTAGRLTLARRLGASHNQRERV